jgi:site-specific recombinase XerD
MEQQEVRTQHFTITIHDTIQDFILSRKAIKVSEGTIKWYERHLGRFAQFAEDNEVYAIDRVDAKLIRKFILAMIEKGYADSYVHMYARQCRTLLRFAYEENYIPRYVKFLMPKIRKKKLPTLSVEEVRKVVKSLDTVRDKAIFLLMVDCGLRLSEVRNLNWGDLDIRRSTLMIRKGKGGNDRVVATSVKVRRLLMKYRRMLSYSDDHDAIFQAHNKKRFAHRGMQTVFLRMSRDSGVKFSAHALRRTFAKMSVRAGRDVLFIQQLMGHANLGTTRQEETTIRQRYLGSLAAAMLT